MSFNAAKPCDNESSEQHETDKASSDSIINQNTPTFSQAVANAPSGSATSQGENDHDKQSPNISALSLSISQVINSTRRKQATPDYGRISHYRSRKYSGRFIPLTKYDRRERPVFISFIKRKVICLCYSDTALAGGWPSGDAISLTGALICSCIDGEEMSEIIADQIIKEVFVFFFDVAENIIVETDYYVENYSSSFFDQAFSNQRCIGKGSFGEVFKALSKDDQRWYAVKITVEPFRSPADRAKRLREIQKHELLPKHPNLVSYVKSWEERGYLYIQTELCQCSLLDYKMKVKVIEEKELWLFFSDIASAICYLHNCDLLHVDIKPQNVMVSFDGVCKLGDFTLILDLKKDVKAEDEGDAKYLAPEVLEHGPSKQSDIFSFGMTMIDICTDLELPNSGDLWHEFRKENISFEYLKNIPPELLQILLPLLAPEANKRPTADEICNNLIVKRYIRQRQDQCLHKNMWWISLTVWFVSLFGVSWIVQPAYTALIREHIHASRMLLRRRKNHRFFLATAEESPLFKVKRIASEKTKRLLLRFDDDDEDYSYENYRNNCESEKMEITQNEEVEEMATRMETSFDEQHPDEVVTAMDTDSPKSSDPAICLNYYDNLPHYLCLSDDDNDIDEESAYTFGAAGDFGREYISDSSGTGSPKKRASLSKKLKFPKKNGCSSRSCSEIEDEDYMMPTTSRCLTEKLNSPDPEIEESDDLSPHREGYVTPPCNTSPSPFVCKTPLRGGDNNSPEQRRRRFRLFGYLRHSPKKNCLNISEHSATPLRDQQEPSTSETKTRIIRNAEDTSRRRIGLKSCEPPAKRPQIEIQEWDGNDSDVMEDESAPKDADTRNIEP